jgi:hypothetical protein
MTSMKKFQVRACRMPSPRFQFEKRLKFFVRANNETLSVVAMASTIQIDHGRDPSQAPAAFLEIVSDDFPMLHCSIFLTGSISQTA